MSINLIQAFMFPTHDDYGKVQQFSYDWLRKNSPWLIYSKECDGGFCLPCVMFARAQSGCQDLGVLVTRPIKVFNKANEVFKKHSQTQYHKNAMIVIYIVLWIEWNIDGILFMTCWKQHVYNVSNKIVKSLNQF